MSQLDEDVSAVVLQRRERISVAFRGCGHGGDFERCGEGVFVWFGKRWYCGRRGSELQEIAMWAVEELSEHTSLLRHDILTSAETYSSDAIETIKLFRWTPAIYVKNKLDDIRREPHGILWLAHGKEPQKVSVDIST